MECPNCHFNNPAGMKFCGECGTRLPTVLPPQDERKIVTALFGDVSGFTALSENLDPEEVKEIMSSCLGQLAQVVVKFGGTVDKFGGDSIFAYFGYPTAHEDDPERAVRAALVMQESMADFNRQLDAQRGLRLQMRIGLNTGLVLAGQLGSPDGHQEQTIMGDTVNTASRLQTIATPGRVVVSESTYRATRHAFEFNTLAPATVKGKHEPVQPYEVIGIRSERGSIRGLGEQQMSAPLIGRATEMQELTAAYEQVVAQRQPVLATLWGMAGGGKSRLVAEFQSQWQQSTNPPIFMRGRCLPFGQGSITYWPLGEMLKHECGILDNEPLAAAQTKLLTRLRTLLLAASGAAPEREVAEIADLLGATLGWSFADSSVAALSGASRREALAWAWRRFFSLKAAAAPLVLFFEDIHWADDQLLDFLEDMVARMSDVPALLICASRPELRERRANWGSNCNGINIDLQPLTASESLLLVNSLLVVDKLPDSVRDLIIARAEGNPFYVEEVIRSLYEGGLIQRQANHWVAVADIENRAIIPDNVQALLNARIDNLMPPEQKRVLQDAAVVGREFWQGAVTSILDGQLPASAVAQHLDGLVQKQLVVLAAQSDFAGEYEYSFRHVLTHDVAYQMLPHASRSHKHRRAAEWLERAAGDRIEEYVERIAYHYEQAMQLETSAAARPGHHDSADQLRDKARLYLKMAGDKNMALQDFRKAERFYANALDIAKQDLGPEDNLNLIVSHANATFFLGNYDEAARQLSYVMSEAQSLSDNKLLTEAMRQLGEVNRQRGQIDEALYLYHQLLPMYHELADLRGEAYAASRLALLHLYKQNLVEANSFAQRANRLASASKDRAVQIQAMQLLTAIYSDVHGDYLSAERTGRELLSLLVEANDRMQMCNLMVNLALVCAYLSKYEDSVAISRQAIETSLDIGYKLVVMRASNTLAHALLALGQPDEAIKHLRHALEISVALGEREVLPEIRRGLAEAHLAQGELDAALEQANAAVAAVMPEDVYSQATTQRTLGMTLAAQGRNNEAETAFGRSIALLEGTAYLPVLAATCERYAAFLSAQGRDDEAATLSERAAELRRRIATPRAEGEADYLLDDLAGGDPATASPN